MEIIIRILAVRRWCFRLFWALAGLSALLLVEGCGGKKRQTARKPVQRVEQTTTPIEEEKVVKEEQKEEALDLGYSYVALANKRDPFRSFFEEFAEELNRQDSIKENLDEVPKTAPERFEIAELKLVGIVTGIPNPRAMVIDPSGLGHVLKRGDKIGKFQGRIVDIRKDEVIISEKKGPEMTPVVIRLHPEEATNLTQ